MDHDALKKFEALLGEISPEDAAARVSELDAEIQDLQHQIEWRRRTQMSLKATFGLRKQRTKPIGRITEAFDPNRVEAPREDFHPNVGALRYGVLDFVRSFDGEPVKLAEITREMIDKGLTPDDGLGKKRVSITAARLAKSGLIERGEQKGYYQLPSGNSEMGSEG